MITKFYVMILLEISWVSVRNGVTSQHGHIYIFPNSLQISGISWRIAGIFTGRESNVNLNVCMLAEMQV